jgi:signal transduction histidine kinase
LRPLFEDVVAQAQPQPGVQISFDCDPTLAVLAEQDLAHEVLAALVDNAMQHTRQGSIRLTAEEGDGTVVISVADTGGVGVLPEHRERIFEPFYRPQASGEGFGLGLAIAAQATKAMHGELGVEDAPDGARFIIRLTAGRILE